MIRHVSTGARGGPDVAEDALDSFSDGFKIGSALLEALMFGPFGFLLAPVLTFHYHVTLGPGSGCGAYLYPAQPGGPWYTYLDTVTRWGTLDGSLTI